MTVTIGCACEIFFMATAWYGAALLPFCPALTSNHVNKFRWGWVSSGHDRNRNLILDIPVLAETAGGAFWSAAFHSMI